MSGNAGQFARAVTDAGPVTGNCKRSTFTGLIAHAPKVSGGTFPLTLPDAMVRVRWTGPSSSGLHSLFPENAAQD